MPSPEVLKTNGLIHVAARSGSKIVHTVTSFNVNRTQPYIWGEWASANVGTRGALVLGPCLKRTSGHVNKPQSWGIVHLGHIPLLHANPTR